MHDMPTELHCWIHKVYRSMYKLNLAASIILCIQGYNCQNILWTRLYRILFQPVESNIFDIVELKFILFPHWGEDIHFRYRLSLILNEYVKFSEQFYLKFVPIVNWFKPDMNHSRKFAISIASFQLFVIIFYF